jgi:hypothetical protein
MCHKFYRFVSVHSDSALGRVLSRVVTFQSGSRRQRPAAASLYSPPPMSGGKSSSVSKGRTLSAASSITSALSVLAATGRLRANGLVTAGVRLRIDFFLLGDFLRDFSLLEGASFFLVLLPVGFFLATAKFLPQEIGGAGGIRTPDLLDAIEARCQLRYGPTAGV